MTPKAFGEAVQQARHRAGLGIAEVAKITGFSRQFLYSLESGDTDTTLGKANRLARALGTSLAELVKSASGVKSR